MGDQNPLKRMRDSAGMGYGTMSSGDETKDALVAQVKNFQRLGGDQKELWGAYADTYLGGVRDPSRHDASVLHEFCANHNVPAVGGGGLACAAGAGAPAPAAAFGAVPPMDAQKAQLVDKVKAFQRNSTENREAW